MFVESGSKNYQVEVFDFQLSILQAKLAIIRMMIISLFVTTHLVTAQQYVVRVFLCGVRRPGSASPIPDAAP